MGGRAAVITGAGVEPRSRNELHLGRSGIRVVANDRNAATAERIAEECRPAGAKAVADGAANELIDQTLETDRLRSALRQEQP